MKILFLTANPLSTQRLQIDEEFKAIKNCLRRSKLRDQIQLIDEWAVEFKDIRLALNEHANEKDKEEVFVHFSGHGAGEQGLVLVEEGVPKTAPPEVLAEMFECFPAVKCVLLNSCYSEMQGRAIVQHVDYVIGMRGAVFDDSAIKFSAAFYEALGYDRSIKVAFKLGCNAIKFNEGNFTVGLRKFISDYSDDLEKAVNTIESIQIPVFLQKEKPSGLVDSTTPQVDSITERLRNKDVSKESALKQFRAEVQRMLSTGALDINKSIQLAVSAVVLGMTEIEVEKILEEKKQSGIEKKPFSFKVATVQVKQDLDAKGSSPEISFRKITAEYFEEPLDENTKLEMVGIPGGNFTMGSPDAEQIDAAKPQHLVRIKQPFFIGMYAVTQEQWYVVATDFLKVNIDLNPDPSYFKGAKHPVERVSWFEAVEFCDRLTKKTGRLYRLPSEAEWEYACRSGTSTPFHFGEIITPELANYNGQVVDNKGVFREQTVDVGSFSANAFGLYDMHGNVDEWCADSWHKNYSGAPFDGTAWVVEGNNKDKVIRGGSWPMSPEVCRSDFRSFNNSGNQGSDIGFRVVCDWF